MAIYVAGYLILVYSGVGSLLIAPGRGASRASRGGAMAARAP
jgi:hypothetical protein